VTGAEGITEVQPGRSSKSARSGVSRNYIRNVETVVRIPSPPLKVLVTGLKVETPAR
jgi:hypothetical protein